MWALDGSELIFGSDSESIKSLTLK
ncbi:hypothetical protein BCEP27_40579 [Burkholderia cepacia]